MQVPEYRRSDLVSFLLADVQGFVSAPPFASVKRDLAIGR